MFCLQNVQTGSGIHPASCSMGTGDFPGGKTGRWCEADHSIPSGAKVKNGGRDMSSPSACHRGGQVDILTFNTTVYIGQCFRSQTSCLFLSLSSGWTSKRYNIFYRLSFLREVYNLYMNGNRITLFLCHISMNRITLSKKCVSYGQ